MYTIGEFAKRVGGAVHTLQRWDREGRLRAHRAVNNRRYYTDEDLVVALGLEVPATKKRCVVYCRVSRPAHKPDLHHQRVVLEQFCSARGLAVDEWIEEVGGGLNFHRQRFLAMVDGVITGEIGTLVIAHKDRLARFGFPLIEHVCEVHTCELMVMNTESLSPEAEMVQGLMTIMQCFSRRLYGLRNYRTTLKEALAHGSNDAQSPQDTAESNA